MTKRWIVPIKEDAVTGDGIIEFPPEMLEEAGWKEGDILDWTDNKDGSFTLTKKETQWVLVEAVSTFRERYMVEVPIGTDNYGKDKKDWALDTVTMNDAKSFSSEHLGEQIVSHRVISMDEALNMCDQDNDYTKSWDEETKIKTFFTEWEDNDKSN
jgi:bifunctional DNA-binding transcriptional regulator/antitoxin component of YhaV-PrlF toxin-antitoxin module